MTLSELIGLIETFWPERFERGLVLHLHKNAVELPNGSRIHLRVMVQEVSPPAPLGGPGHPPDPNP